MVEAKKRRAIRIIFPRSRVQRALSGRALEVLRHGGIISAGVDTDVNLTIPSVTLKSTSRQQEGVAHDKQCPPLRGRNWHMLTNVGYVWCLVVVKGERADG